MGIAPNMAGILQRQGGQVVQPPATGATAGQPGTWAPAGAKPPSNLAGMSGITPVPATAWPTGSYVLLHPSGSAYWNGTAWALGVAP
jgi:hypothetical protein